MSLDFPAGKIREYRTRMHRIQEDADDCEQCAASPGGVDVYEADTLCAEHAAASAIIHHEFKQYRKW